MLVLGNWKLNTSLTEAVTLASDVVRATESDATSVDVGLCPPYVWLEAVAERLRGSAVTLGAQSVSAETEGAFTGEVSASMLAEIGCRTVIVGHSERRALYGESDAIVAAKLAAVQRAGLLPVVCVGETLEQRDAGDAEAVVLSSLRASTDGAMGPFVVAYEPVWAIGTGRTASPEQAGAMHDAIRTSLSAAGVDPTPILYGGSVKPDNAALLFEQPAIDGALVGGASLDAGAFAAIVAAARAAE